MFIHSKNLCPRAVTDIINTLLPAVIATSTTQYWLRSMIRLAIEDAFAEMLMAHSRQGRSENFVQVGGIDF
jgi:hypothetical protein